MSIHSTMKSYKVTDFGAPLQEVIESVRVPKGSEVLLRVKTCGVCHSDLHLSDGHFDLGGGKQMDLSRTLQLPRTLGHEIVGEVVAVGESVSGLSVGSQWLVYPWIGCGQCSLCRAGDEHLCAQPRTLGISVDGGFSDHVIVPDARYLIDYGNVPPDVACTYACSGLTAFSALRKAGAITAEDPLMIIGAGGVGQSAIRLCMAIHGIGASVADIDPAKRQAALEAGAVRAADPLDPDARRNLMKATGGYAAVIDFVGTPKTVEFGMALLRKGGKLIVVGLFGGAVEISIPMLPLRSISIEGSYVGRLDELQELAALGREGKVPSIQVAHRTLEQAQQTLDDLRGGKVAGRAVLHPATTQD
jgi:D-arabinose 1-dehydrogenase-like Zn-dependent alcohol dehydrogenase